MTLRFLYSFLLLFTVANFANATHIVGGYIHYRHISGTQYQMTMTIYRDCTSQVVFDGEPGGPSGTPQYASVGLFEVGLGGQFSLVQEFQLTNPVVTTFSNTSTNPCLVVPPGVCVEQGVYTTTFNVPDQNREYMLVYERCCRNGSITNLNLPGTQGAAYTATIPTTNPFQNSNPTFNQFPPLFICVNTPLVFDHSATDLNGDSLSYSLCEPLNGASQAIPAPSPPNFPPYPVVVWDFPFNANDPLGGVPLSIDPTTGLLTGTPNQIGQFVVGVCVSEFRNGVLLGTYLRDFQFNVSQCNVPDASIPFVPGSFSPTVGYGIYENKCSDFLIDFSRGTSFAPAPGASAPLSYFWDFGVPGITTDTSTQRLPTYLYPDTGTYTVTVVVSQIVNGVGCSDTSRAIVRIYPNLDADFSFSPSACQDTAVAFTDLSISTAAPITNWLWTFGDGTTSSLRNPVKKYNAPGTYSVKLQITNSVGCVDSVRKTITVHPQPVSDFTFNTPCESEPTNFLFSGSGNITDYNWVLDPGITNVNSNPSYVYPTSGIRQVRLIVVNNFGCRDTIVKPVNVLPRPVIGLTPNTTICNGASITLIATGGTQYSWSADTTLSSTSIANPTAGPLFQNNTYYVTVTAANGCSRNDSVTITVRTPPNVDAGQDTSVCFNPGSFRDSVRLQATGAISYTWSPPTGLNNPNISNPTSRPLVNTTYLVTGVDGFGCSSTDTVRVYFLDPSLNLIIENDVTICVFDTATLTILEQGAGSYQWTPPTGLSNPLSNTPVFFPTTTTNYIFTIQNYCYQKRDTVTVFVNQLPNVSTQKLDSLCIGDSVQLVATGATSYVWQTSPTLSDTSISNPLAFPSVNTTYFVEGTDANGCKNRDSVLVLVYFPPLTDVLPDTTFICQGQPVRLNAIGGVRYLWQSDPSLSSTTIGNPIATPLDTTTYYVEITNIHSCSTLDTITINVQLPVVATTQSPYDFCTGKSVQLNAEGGFYYNWTPPISLSNPRIKNPVANPTSSIVYTVEVSNDCFSDTATVVLTIRPLPIVDAGNDTTIYRNTNAFLNGVSNVAENYWAPGQDVRNPLDLNTTANPIRSRTYFLYAISEYGCKSYDSIRITVEPFTQVFIPTAFSPNGDGENDIFRIVPPTLNIMAINEFAVYNRWGEKVYSTSDINAGWDGTYKNKAQEIGVYIWYIKAITFDGDPVFKKGNVTLIR